MNLSMIFDNKKSHYNMLGPLAWLIDFHFQHRIFGEKIFLHVLVHEDYNHYDNETGWQNVKDLT